MFRSPIRQREREPHHYGRRRAVPRAQHLPGTYTVEREGQRLQRTHREGLIVDVSQAHDLGKLQLVLGNVTESVSVTAEVAAVETASSDRSPLLDSSELNLEAIKGRDLMSYMKLCLE